MKLEMEVQGLLGPFLLYRNGQPAARLESLHPYTCGSLHCAYFVGLVVEEPFRGIGLGRIFVEWAFHQYPMVEVLTCRSTAHGFYQALGGIREGEMFSLWRSRSGPRRGGRVLGGEVTLRRMTGA